MSDDPSFAFFPPCQTRLGGESFDSIVCRDGDLCADPRGNTVDNVSRDSAGGVTGTGARGGNGGRRCRGMSPPNFLPLKPFPGPPLGH
jgi:hypothetical protein